MIQDMWIAVFAGLVGTTVMTGMMLVSQKFGLPSVDVHGI